MRTVHITDRKTRESSEMDVYMDYRGENVRELIKIAVRMRPDRILLDLSRENAIKCVLELQEV